MQISTKPDFRSVMSVRGEFVGTRVGWREVWCLVYQLRAWTDTYATRARNRYTDRAAVTWMRNSAIALDIRAMSTLERKEL